MKVYFPSYYNKFKCIAEKCRHSCCVGWEIEVDADTLKKYECREDISRHVSDGVIQLSEGDRCPFLTECGLCRIISELGEEYTSVICREHPRFYHRIGERVEGGIGMSCEEAARIILTSDSYRDFISTEKQSVSVPNEALVDTLGEREKIYRILADKALPYRDRIAKIRDEYALPKSVHTKEEWRDIFSELELLGESHRELMSIGEYEENEENSVYFERFIAYLVFRHVSIAESADNLRARLAFCLLLAQILESYVSQNAGSESEIVDAARIISEEIEYSEDNTSALIFEMECVL